MDAKAFRAPTKLERAFLHVVTRGYAALERQIETCEISDYDAVGYYDVRVVDGEPMTPVPKSPIEGPLLDLSHADAPQPAIVQIGEPAVYAMTRTGEPALRVPYVPPNHPRLAAIDILLWTDERGFLSSVEVCSIGDGYVADPCAVFVEAFAARTPRLQFRAISEDSP